MRPQDILPDESDAVVVGGMAVRKGSVGAFLANVALLRRGGLSEAERTGLLRDQLALVPALRAIGLFDVFAIKDDELRALVDAQP